MTQLNKDIKMLSNNKDFKLVCQGDNKFPYPKCHYLDVKRGDVSMRFFYRKEDGKLISKINL